MLNDRRGPDDDPTDLPPFDHGCDLSIHAGTKYIVGHSDAMMGIISCATRPMFELVKTACMNFGFHAAPDDSYLALRGLRTMGVRLRHQGERLNQAKL